MPFTNEEYLKLDLTASRIDSFNGAFPGQLALLIAASDKIITHESKLQPPADAKDASPEVRRFAAWIVLYLMTDSMSGVTQEEYDRRFDKYREAIRRLATMEGVAVGTATEAPAVQSTSTERLGEML